NVISPCPETPFAVVYSLTGDVQHRNINKSIFQKIINKRRIASAHIDDSRFPANARAGDHLYRCLKMLAKPTDLIAFLSLINILPMPLPFHIAIRSSKPPVSLRNSVGNIHPANGRCKTKYDKNDGQKNGGTAEKTTCMRTYFVIC